MTVEPLIVFAKAPVAGRVKSRLVPPLTPDEAAAVAEACLYDVVDRARAVSEQVVLCYDEVGSAGWFRREFPELTRWPQVSGGLGRRLVAAIDRAIREGAERVGLIGADSPTLPATQLTAGMQALRAADLGLGPTSDGGYYLVSVREAAWPRAVTIFTEIPWSSSRVLAETLRRARAAGLSYRLLDPWYDIDRFEDLLRARREADPRSRLARLMATDEMSRRLTPPARMIPDSREP